MYRREFGEMLSWSGVRLNHSASYLETCAPPRTHFSQRFQTIREVQKPLRNRFCAPRRCCYYRAEFLAADILRSQLLSCPFDQLRPRGSRY
jgi:hypothetical protein